MGYTHYWKMSRDFTDKEYEKIEDIARKLMYSMEGRKTLGFEAKQNDHVHIKSGDYFRFNGKRKYDHDHETFVLGRVQQNGFCKTGRKPYDKFVTAMLILALAVAPDAIEVKSDGERDDWVEGQKLLSKYLYADLPKTIETGKLEIA